MKKILVAATAAVALATPALAFDVKWSGDLNNRFSYSTQADLMRNTGLSGEGYNNTYVNLGDNISRPIDTQKKSNDSDFFGEIKYRLTMTGTDDDKKVKGVVGFEFGANKFGASGADFAGDDNNFEFRWGYVDFEVPFDPASHLIVGLQPAGYNKFLWSDNGGGVKWVSKRGKLGYSLGWFRDDLTNGGIGDSTTTTTALRFNDANNNGTVEAGELVNVTTTTQNTKSTNDDVYAFDVTYTIDNGPKLNGFALYREDGQESIAGVSGVQDKKLWLGLAGEGQAGALFYGFTGIYQTGELKVNNETLDREAYLLNAEVTYKFDKLRVKAGWLYSSGDDDATDDDVENFQNIDAYMGGFGSVVVFDGLADDNSLVTSPYILDKGLNMPYIGVDYDLNDKASIGASYLYIATAEDFDGSRDTDTSGDTELGHEISVRASYKITKNLTTGIEAGYLIGGDVWDELASEGDGDDVIRTNANVRFTF